MIVRLGDGAMLRGESRLNIGEELPRRKGLFGRVKKRPMVGRLENLLWVASTTHSRFYFAPAPGDDDRAWIGGTKSRGSTLRIP